MEYDILLHDIIKYMPFDDDPYLHTITHLSAMISCWNIAFIN